MVAKVVSSCQAPFSPLTRALYAIIVDSSDDGNGDVEQDVAGFALRLGCSEPTIRRAIATLKRHELVAVDRMVGPGGMSVRSRLIPRNPSVSRSINMIPLQFLDVSRNPSVSRGIRMIDRQSEPMRPENQADKEVELDRFPPDDAKIYTPIPLFPSHAHERPPDSAHASAPVARQEVSYVVTNVGSSYVTSLPVTRTANVVAIANGSLRGRESAEREGTSMTIGGWEAFWAAYPRKVAKRAAFKAWTRLQPGADLIERIVADVKLRAESYDWTRDQRRFVPHPATYLNGERWEDDPPLPPPSGIERARRRPLTQSEINAAGRGNLVKLVL